MISWLLEGRRLLAQPVLSKALLKLGIGVLGQVEITGDLRLILIEGLIGGVGIRVVIEGSCIVHVVRSPSEDLQGLPWLAGGCQVDGAMRQVGLEDATRDEMDGGR